ncbi:MAG TPA: hypothetical protein PLO37_14765 [Candidatus Hydrogenedentes bacterium]|nr:hypothetical protein [Candidatus Hydrogenedentota bacterium]HPG68108.1 hypothetical protein [Candidatus Hydrogenedentota bacterium]
MDAVQQPLCRVIPGMGVCSRATDPLVHLLSRPELSALNRVAVHADAAGVAAYARVILKERFDATPEFVMFSVSHTDLSDFDGLLVLNTLPVDRTGFDVHVDIGANPCAPVESAARLLKECRCRNRGAA